MENKKVNSLTSSRPANWIFGFFLMVATLVGIYDAFIVKAPLEELWKDSKIIFIFLAWEFISGILKYFFKTETVVLDESKIINIENIYPDKVRVLNKSSASYDTFSFKDTEFKSSIQMGSENILQTCVKRYKNKFLRWVLVIRPSGEFYKITVIPGLYKNWMRKYPPQF